MKNVILFSLLLLLSALELQSRVAAAALLPEYAFE